MGEYFNYGFNEDTWKKYRSMILQRAEEVEQLNKDENLKKRFENRKLNHAVLDFYTPHEFGGLGDCIEERYQQINIFPDTVDIPVIKPRTTVNNKNEFNVTIQKAIAED